MTQARTTVISVRGQSRVVLLADARHVYVGRACCGWPWSKWSNPFKIRRADLKDGPGNFCATPAEALQRYKDYIRAKIRTEPERYDLAELRGKVLCCWCGRFPENPDLQCHAVVLALLAEGMCA